MIKHVCAPFKDDVMPETNVQNYWTKMNATINQGCFKNDITHKRETKSSTKDMPACGREHDDANVTLPNVPSGANSEIHVTSS